MSNYDHRDIPVADPPPPTLYTQPTGESYPNGPQVTAPPPVGYPTKDGAHDEGGMKHHTPETTIRGEGFWKGCVAAICCCWVLDFCFGC